MDMTHTQSGRFLVLSFFMGIFFISCIKSPHPSADGSRPTSGESEGACKADQASKDQLIAQLMDTLDEPCRREILEKLPLPKLLQTLSPKDPSLQRVVKDQVQGLWPQWFLDQIAKKGDPKKYLERLVVYYLAFLKMPIVLKDNVSFSRLVQPLTIHELWNADTIQASVGDHFVAYFDKRQQHLNIFDTQKNQIVAHGRVPWGGAPFSPASNAFVGGSIEAVAKNKLILRLSYEEEGEVSVWSWNESGELKRIHSQKAPAHTRYFFHDTLSVLRVSDQRFVTLSVETSPELILDLWEMDKQEKISTTKIKNCFSGNGTDPAATKKCLKNLEEAGLKVDSAIFLTGPFSIGFPIDQKTEVVASDSAVFLRLKNNPSEQKTLPLFRVNEWNFHIEHINKNGDIIYRIGGRMFYVNIWKIVSQIVEDQKNIFPCQ